MWEGGAGRGRQACATCGGRRCSRAVGEAFGGWDWQKVRRIDRCFLRATLGSFIANPTLPVALLTKQCSDLSHSQLYSTASFPTTHLLCAATSVPTAWLR